MIRPRKPLRQFVNCMETELRANDHKGHTGWRAMDLDWLLRKLDEEVRELHEAARKLQAGNHCPGCGAFLYEPATTPAKVRSEAADVANVAMFIADVCGCLEDGK